LNDAITKEPKMNRTTVMLPSELKQKASRRSREMGISFGEFVRISIQDELARHYPEQSDSLFADTAVFAGEAPVNAADNHDELLYGSES
jgi:hypothetical protein